MTIKEDHKIGQAQRLILTLCLSNFKQKASLIFRNKARKRLSITKQQ